MSEVLYLEYEASGPSIRVELDVVQELVAEDGSKRTLLLMGQRTPQRHVPLEKLARIAPQLEADLRSVLKRLEPVVRELAAQDVANPDRVREEANAVAMARQELERKVAAAERAVDDALVERKRIELETQAARAAHEAEVRRLEELKATAKLANEASGAQG